VGEVHQLILDIGVDGARQLAADKVGRQCVDAAFSVMSDENFDIGITHAGFAITALPHKPFLDRVWERSGGKNGEITLRIESGANRNGDLVGIPSGAIARLILFHLSSEAYVNNSRIVELGSSMRAFLSRMGISPGGKTLKIVREQSRRIALCRLTFFNEGKKNTMVSNGSFVRNAILGNTQDETTPFWQDTVELDEGFFNSLKDHPLPLREAAIRQLSNKSLALDIYVYLAYRLHVLQKPTPVSWAALYAQFGGGVKEKKVFVNGFKEPLALALSAYPEAKVQISETGLLLHPSDSPVPKTPIRGNRVASFRSSGGLTLIGGSSD
jgi:hypothetical protein